MNERETISPPELRLKTFVIRAGMAPGNVWIGRLDEAGHEGEGGDFNIDEFEDMIEGFYNDRF